MTGNVYKSAKVLREGWCLLYKKENKEKTVVLKEFLIFGQKVAVIVNTSVIKFTVVLLKCIRNLYNIPLDVNKN